MVAQRGRAPCQQLDRFGRRPPYEGRERIKGQKHPQEPCRSARPWTDHDHVSPVQREVELGEVVAIVGNGHHDQDRDQEGDAEPKGAHFEKTSRCPARQTAVNEQAGDEEHAGHEVAVVEQHDEVETEPAHPVAADAEMGVVDRGVVQHDREGDEGARAIERNDSFRRPSALAFVIGGSLHRFSPWPQIRRRRHDVGQLQINFPCAAPATRTIRRKLPTDNGIGQERRPRRLSP
jgi:hypothetical protein